MPRHFGFPCGQTRREFVWQMGGGFAGTALTALLAADGFFAKVGYGAEAPPAGSPGLMPKRPHFTPRARSEISASEPVRFSSAASTKAPLWAYGTAICWPSISRTSSQN